MVTFGIISGADLELAVSGFGLFTATRELVAKLDQSLHRLRAESIAAIGETGSLQKTIESGFGLTRRLPFGRI